MDTRIALILVLILLLGGGLVFGLFGNLGGTGLPDLSSGGKPIREAILAETIVLSIDYGTTVPNDCSDPAQFSVPNDILYANNGQQRTASEIDEYFGDIFCLIESTTQGLESTPEANIDHLIRLFDGVDVTFNNGIVVPGSNPSVRAALFYLTMVGVSFSERLVLGDDQCSILADWAVEGETLEKRTLGFALYMVLEGACIDETPTGSTAEMLERTRAGEIDAAIQLVKYWNIDNLGGIPTSVQARDPGQIDAKIDYVSEIIEAERDVHPLVVAAATLELINLAGLKKYPAMLFR